MGQFRETKGGAPACRTGKKAPTTPQAYKNDPFKFENGHCVGHDGFVVPKDFEEFYERFPDHVFNWVRKHAENSATKEDKEEWEQQLLLHLLTLPPTSKYLAIGKKDVVQTFDPVRQHGANEARFLNYINLCLTNKFRTMRSSRMKDALCRHGNVSLRAQAGEEDFGSVGDEYCHSHSNCLREASKRSEKQAHDRARVQQFENFVNREDPRLVSLIRALAATRTQCEAADWLRITKEEFSRRHWRLRLLARSFRKGERVPKRRRPYRRRTAVTQAHVALSAVGAKC